LVKQRFQKANSKLTARSDPYFTLYDLAAQQANVPLVEQRPLRAPMLLKNSLFAEVDNPL
jgi:hypothetical protein